MDLYRSKNAIVHALDPVVERLQRLGVTPDAVTLAAIPVGLLAGALLLALARGAASFSWASRCSRRCASYSTSSTARWRGGPG